VAVCTKEVHYFASDEAGAPKDDNFHVLIEMLVRISPLMTTL
jgi:hypothetical protein